MIMTLGPKHPRLSGQLVSPCSLGMTSVSLTTSSSSCSTWVTRSLCSVRRCSSMSLRDTCPATHVSSPAQWHVTVMWRHVASCWSRSWGRVWLNLDYTLHSHFQKHRLAHLRLHPAAWYRQGTRVRVPGIEPAWKIYFVYTWTNFDLTFKLNRVYCKDLFWHLTIVTLYDEDVSLLDSKLTTTIK